MSEPKIARIDQSKLRESVYEELRDAFTRGVFAPGESVSLRTLADQLGTSMTPVREAVRRLVAEGALVDTPSRTLEVPPFDADRMRELKSARLALEAILLDEAIDHMDDAAIDALAAIIARPRPEGELPDLTQNYEFHFTLYRQSRSRVILPLVEALWLQYGAFLNLVVQEKAASEIPEHIHHEEIIAALHAKDRAAAQKALALDIERSFKLLLPET
ncbi:GntR family transcriptional regulator [Roseibium alexandrii]|uniref:Transcriptional regulator n=1 Tax=Roseibium alexandrii (strain DSM 17067 / NCIMB 14079 / DFL-11) TaxID=244592 RepID=A0A5E8H5P3_ROSAD|nr:GntR family transcriptional regulator [Roseibium alexandrii]EEE47804.1 Transcriptional regulator [Roseibium alexandrii DFL-11]